MTGSVIKNSLMNGYPGTYSHTPDLIISPYVVGETFKDGLTFGDGCFCDFYGKANLSGVNNQGFGVVARTVQTPNDYLNQSAPKCYPGDVIGVVVRGDVETYVAQDDSNTGGQPCQTRLDHIAFSSEADENGVAEITILERKTI